MKKHTKWEREQFGFPAILCRISGAVHDCRFFGNVFFFLLFIFWRRTNEPFKVAISMGIEWLWTQPKTKRDLFFMCNFVWRAQHVFSFDYPPSPTWHLVDSDYFWDGDLQHEDHEAGQVLGWQFLLWIPKCDWTVLFFFVITKGIIKIWIKRRAVGVGQGTKCNKGRR